MTERPAAPPEGELIKTALAAVRISQREAARRAKISDTRWRQIVSGYQSIGGEKVRFRSPADTVARMAHVVELRPEQLEAVGRDDVATALRAIVAKEKEAEETPVAEGSQSRVDERWHMLEALLRQARAGLNPAEDSTLVGRINGFFAQTPEWQAPEGPPAADGRRQKKPGV